MKSKVVGNCPKLTSIPFFSFVPASSEAQEGPKMTFYWCLCRPPGWSGAKI